VLQITPTSQYSTVTNSHTLQFTTACTKFPQSLVSSPVVCLVMTSDVIDPSDSMFMASHRWWLSPISVQLPY
jgi:hypothetical protein